MKNVKFNDWPECDRVAFCAKLQPGSILDAGSGSLAHLRAPSIKQLKYGYGCWLGYLLSHNIFDVNRSGIEFLSPELFREYVALLRSILASKTVVGYIDQFGRLARLLHPQSDWQLLQTTARQLQRNLRPFRDIRTRCRPSIELYHLDNKLIEKSEGRPNPMSSAREFRNGLIIAFLAARPLRIRNLSMIAVNRHLQLRGEKYWLHFDRGETKGDRDLDFPWPEPLNGALSTYLQVHRPVIIGQSGIESDAAGLLWMMSSGGLYEMITTQTARWFGQPVNPQSFRHAAATSAAIEDPEHVGIVTTILGHSSFRTAEKYYNMATSIDAARRYQKCIVKLRKT